VHGEITHLAWERLEIAPEENAWAFVDIAIDLLDVTEVFLKELDRSYHTAPVRELRAEASLMNERFAQMKNEKRLTFDDMFGFLQAVRETKTE
jgi:hypothetical protein